MGMARNRALNHMSARPWKTPRLLATRHAHATARAALTLWSNAARHPPLPPAHRQQFGEHAQRPSRAKRGDHATVLLHALPRSRASPRLVRAALLSPARRLPPHPSPAANGRAVGSQKAWVRGPVGVGLGPPGKCCRQSLGRCCKSRLSKVLEGIERQTRGRARPSVRGTVACMQMTMFPSNIIQGRLGAAH